MLFFGMDFNLTLSYTKELEAYERKKKRQREASKRFYDAHKESVRAQARIDSRKRYARIKANPQEHAVYKERQMIRKFVHDFLVKILLERSDNKCEFCDTPGISTPFKIVKPLEFHSLKNATDPDDIIVCCRKCHIENFHS